MSYVLVALAVAGPWYHHLAFLGEEKAHEVLLLHRAVAAAAESSHQVRRSLRSRSRSSEGYSESNKSRLSNSRFLKDIDSTEQY
jgi:hypothetical protein